MRTSAALTGGTESYTPRPTVGRGVYDSVPPVNAAEVRISLVPQEGVALAADGVNVKVGAVAVPFLVGTGLHLGYVGVHGAVGEHEHHVAAALSPGVPCLQLEAGQIRYVVGLPHVPPGSYRDECAVPAEVPVAPGA